MPDKTSHRREISGILYLTMAVLLAVSFYVPSARTGLLGKALTTAGHGLIGLSAYALPALFLYMAIERFLATHPRMTSERFRYILLLVICVAALMHVLTIDLIAFRALAESDANDRTAYRSLIILFQSGADPGLFPEIGSLMSGGLVGGLVATAMASLTGVTGAAIILSAFILTLLVLLFNVSYSRAIGKTAAMLSQTGQRMNEAVRTSVSTLRQNIDTDKDQARQSYDFKVGQGSGMVRSPDKTSVNESRQFAETDARAAGGFATVGETDRTERVDTGEAAGSSFWNSLFHPKSRSRSGIDNPETQATNQAAGHEDQSIPTFLRDAAAPVAAGSTGGFILDGAVDEADADFINLISTQDQSDEDDVTVDLPAGIRRIDENEPLAEKAKPEGPGATGKGEGPADHRRHVKADQIPLPYQLPPLHLLNADTGPGSMHNQMAIQELGRKLESTLKSFGVEARVVNYTAGSTITRFELTPGPGVKVSRIVSLADDIALNLAAMGVRIEAPIPGKSAIGIEIPNKETTAVLLRSILESPEYARSKAPLTAALGRDIQGTPILCDIARMPHLLIAGATGSGKSVCINTILMSILFRCKPEDVRMLMIDPKVVELSIYNGIPHLLSPVVTDPKKAANTLLWAVNEMVRRYGLFAEKSVRDIHGYQAAAKEYPDEYEKMPLILLVIDELADLMSTAPTEVEDAIARLTAMARAAGIHLIIATQRPSVDVITGVIKANIPSRIAFAVASQVDSRTILDMGGAEKLLGKGDMLYFPQSLAKPVRGQGAFVSDTEVEKVLAFIKSNHTDGYDATITEAIMASTGNVAKNGDNAEQDELLPNAAEIVVEAGYASVSLLQRRMNVGYPRAARLIDRMQEKGYVGPFEGSKPRKVLLNAQQLMELKSRGEL